VDIAGFHAAERRGDTGGTDLHYSDCPFPPVMVAALHIAHGDTAESIAYFERAFHCKTCTEPLLSSPRVAGCAIQLDASKRIGEASGSGVADVERTVTVVELRFAADAADVHVAETVLYQEWRIGRNAMS